MTATISFTVPGKPFAKERPRFSRKSGRAVTPKATVSFENTVRALASQIFKRPIEGPVSVIVEAVFEPPQSWSKKKKAAHLSGYWHTQKPDSDNIEKAIHDGLNRIAIVDDSQIAHSVCTKTWGKEARTDVTIVQLESGQ